MNKDELGLVMTSTALRLLDSLPPYSDSTDIVKTVAALRRDGHPADLVSAVLTQSRLRAKATAKFGEFASRMLFTEAGLEQATRLRVAALHAGRYQSAGIRSVADLGCGIGADALAFAALDLEVQAVELDEVTAAIASYNLAPFTNVTVSLGDAAQHDLASVESVYLDPARRTAGHADTRRLPDPRDYSPSLDFAFGVARTLPTGIKLGPGFDRSLIPDDAEAQWISVDGQLVENSLWFGSLARPGIARSALVLRGGASAELVSDADSPDAETGELGTYLYEPDGSVIRARLIGDLARSLGARMLSEQIAYLSSDDLVSSPFATAFRVVDTLPSDESKLKKELRRRGIGRLEIKKRGVDVDPAVLRRRLSLSGDGEATLVLTRVAGRHTAILAERV
ncbi:SAM-dependent methyltransferase [Agreia sp. Leaf244]|uniref:THUMP-like domain-containing protein n=1 Tax=unclassified Agreia TaxID=2641148 RepID=UPI0006FE73F7|nr:MULTISPECIES: class I SAM-dependent methyltransferase [unclassified Agreia]KQO09756.1 SAM-dependent methyltransferase [Agreia sp. Leaf244]KQP57736.1 SAM-dependent methyltransferase [Agreia sp. Leaf283]